MVIKMMITQIPKVEVEIPLAVVQVALVALLPEKMKELVELVQVAALLEADLLEAETVVILI